MFDSRRLLTMLATVGLSLSALCSFTAQAQTTQAAETGSEATQSSDDPTFVNFWRPGDPGQRLHIQGQVRSAIGDPLPGAVLNVWQADGTGQYQPDRYRAVLTTDKDGKYRFGTVLPGQYYGVKHIHVVVSHPSHRPIQTQIVFKGDPNLDPSTQRDHGVFLEEASVNGETILHGRFDVQLRPGGG